MNYQIRVFFDGIYWVAVTEDGAFEAEGASLEAAVAALQAALPGDANGSATWVFLG